jgi:hypothetical protein
MKGRSAAADRYLNAVLIDSVSSTVREKPRWDRRKKEPLRTPVSVLAAAVEMVSDTEYYVTMHILFLVLSAFGFATP